MASAIDKTVKMVYNIYLNKGVHQAAAKYAACGRLDYVKTGWQFMTRQLFSPKAGGIYSVSGKTPCFIFAVSSVLHDMLSALDAFS